MPAPTLEELVDADYSGTSPENAGMLAERFATLLYTPHAHTFTWQKAYDAPAGAVGPGGETRTATGRIYVTQTVADDARVAIYSTKRTLTDAEFGTFEVGSTGIATLSHWAEFARLDRISLTAVSLIRRQFVKRGAGVTDTLTHAPVASIISVHASTGTAFNASLYAVAANERGITWDAGEGPSAGAFYYLEYRQRVVFEYLLDEQAPMQLGADGAKLPQRGVVRMLQPGEW